MATKIGTMPSIKHRLKAVVASDRYWQSASMFDEKQFLLKHVLRLLYIVYLPVFQNCRVLSKNSFLHIPVKNKMYFNIANKCRLTKKETKYSPEISIYTHTQPGFRRTS